MNPQNPEGGKVIPIRPGAVGWPEARRLSAFPTAALRPDDQVICRSNEGDVMFEVGEPPYWDNLSAAAIHPPATLVPGTLMSGDEQGRKATLLGTVTAAWPPSFITPDAPLVFWAERGNEGPQTGCSRMVTPHTISILPGSSGEELSLAEVAEQRGVEPTQEGLKLVSQSRIKMLADFARRVGLTESPRAARGTVIAARQTDEKVNSETVTAYDRQAGTWMVARSFGYGSDGTGNALMMSFAAIPEERRKTLQGRLPSLGEVMRLGAAVMTHTVAASQLLEAVNYTPGGPVLDALVEPFFRHGQYSQVPPVHIQVFPGNDERRVHVPKTPRLAAASRQQPGSYETIVQRVRLLQTDCGGHDGLALRGPRAMESCVPLVPPEYLLDQLTEAL